MRTHGLPWLLCSALSLAACSNGNVAGMAGDVDPGPVDPGAGDPGHVGDGDLGVDDGAAAIEVDAGGAQCGPQAKTGDYCGNDKIVGGDKDTLYTCAGANSAPTKAKKCTAGCTVAPAGMDDFCQLPSSPKSYRLPWMPGTTMQLTQDCDDSCCSDHVGNDEYAYDWANGTSFLVRAARAGTITHLKINSTTGCATTACSVDVNMLVIDHGDGTQAIYMHLKGDSAQAGVTCGAHVNAGQPLAYAGTTGHSTGVHLHFQVSQVHPTAPTCECGANGKQCATTFNPFPNTWVNTPYHTVPINFGEWPTASQCNNRRITMPAAAP